MWLPANQFEICVICLRYVGYGQERHKLCFDIFVFVCQPRSLKTLQLQQTFRSEELLKSISNHPVLDLTVCLGLNQSLKLFNLTSKTRVASFRLEMFRVSASGTLRAATWRAEPHRIAPPPSLPLFPFLFLSCEKWTIQPFACIGISAECRGNSTYKL